MPIPCNCCSTGVNRCYSTDDGLEFRRATHLACSDGTNVWHDSFTGDALTATERARLTDCPPDILDPCSLTDPSTLEWQAVPGQPQVFTKDLGQGFVITARRGAGNHNPMQIIRTANCSAVDNTMLGLRPVNNQNNSYNLNQPAIIEFTATRPWPQPWAIRTFDVDGNSNTTKHSGPNETISPQWGAPTSITGPHASLVRDKGAGQYGVNQGAQDGVRFNFNYAGPLPDTLTLHWHGYCIGFDFALPANC